EPLDRDRQQLVPLGDELRAHLDGRAVVQRARPDAAADPLAALPHHDLGARCCELLAGHQAGQAGADDADAGQVSGAVSKYSTSRRMRSPSISTIIANGKSSRPSASRSFERNMPSAHTRPSCSTTFSSVIVVSVISSTPGRTPSEISSGPVNVRGARGSS